MTVKNNEGATDTVVIDNVTMKYSSGTYGDQNGEFHEDTGKVRLFTDLTSTEPIAVVKATQPNESYKQRGVGIATFENLELNPEGRPPVLRCAGRLRHGGDQHPPGQCGLRA